MNVTVMYNLQSIQFEINQEDNIKDLYPKLVEALGVQAEDADQNMSIKYGKEILDAEKTVGDYNIEDGDQLRVTITEPEKPWPRRVQKRTKAAIAAKEKENMALKAKIEEMEKEKEEKEKEAEEKEKERVTDEMIILLQKKYDKASEEANEATKLVFKHKAEGATKSELLEPLANEKAAKTNAKSLKQELDEAKARKKQQDKEDKENKMKKQNIMDKDPKDTYLAALH